MIQVTPQMRILVAVEAADFRKGIDGLARICKEALKQDPFGGAVFESYPIYEAAFVKPPVQEKWRRSLRTFPLAVGVGRSGPSQPSPRDSGVCLLPHILLSPRWREIPCVKGCSLRNTELGPTGRDTLNHLFGIARLRERRHEENIRRTPPFKLTPVDDGITDRASLGVVLGVVTSTGLKLDKLLRLFKTPHLLNHAWGRPLYTIAA
ncbi:MAG: IS66 family insertion sequence element accessory protein TnpB [Phycisphaerae bacterium]